jgi:hypothetical protein
MLLYLHQNKQNRANGGDNKSPLLIDIWIEDWLKV